MLRLYAAKLMSIQTRVHAVTSDGLDAARAVESITAGQADSTHISCARTAHTRSNTEDVVSFAQFWRLRHDIVAHHRTFRLRDPEHRVAILIEIELVF